MIAQQQTARAGRNLQPIGQRLIRGIRIRAVIVSPQQRRDNLGFQPQFGLRVRQQQRLADVGDDDLVRHSRDVVEVPAKGNRRQIMLRFLMAERRFARFKAQGHLGIRTQNQAIAALLDDARIERAGVLIACHCVGQVRRERQAAADRKNVDHRHLSGSSRIAPPVEL